MAFLLAGLAAWDANAEELSRTLRGYGETRAERKGDTVVIEAESAEKAQLWAARYLHVNEKLKVGEGVLRLPDGGYSQVSCDGRTVRIRYSANRPKDGRGIDGG